MGHIIHLQKTVSAASTTSLRSHLTATHKNVLIKELRSDEAMDPSNVTTLKSLKQDFGVVEKYKDGFKRALDEQFVKLCCKKRRAFSCGETDRELKSWMLQVTRGRYQPPSRKTTMDTLLSTRAKSDNELTKDLKALLAERIYPSISGIVLFLVVDVTAYATCAAHVEYVVDLLYCIIYVKLAGDIMG